MKTPIQTKQKTLYSRQESLKINATNSEITFKNKLDLLGIRYLFQKGFISGNGYYFVDFYLPKPYKVCVEIDGGYHNTIEQKYKDSKKDRYLIEERNFKVLRIKNEDVEKFDIESYLKNS